MISIHLIWNRTKHCLHTVSAGEWVSSSVASHLGHSTRELKRSREIRIWNLGSVEIRKRSTHCNAETWIGVLRLSAILSHWTLASNLTRFPTNDCYTSWTTTESEAKILSGSQLFGRSKSECCMRRPCLYNQTCYQWCSPSISTRTSSFSCVHHRPTILNGENKLGLAGTTLLTTCCPSCRILQSSR